MKLKHTALWSGVVAAALLLTACGKSNSGSGSMSSSGMSSSGFTNPVAILGTVIIVIGVVMLIAGIILAVYLKKRGNAK